MSGLVFEGDIVFSTGEYLPAPYINKIFVDETEITIENFIFLDDYNDVNLVDSDGNVSNSREIYKQQVSGLNYYIMLLEGFSEETYESIIKNETNPILFYHQYFEQKDAGSQELDDTAISMYLFDAISESQKDFFSESGERVTAYSTQNLSTNLEPPERGGTFNKINYVFCFSSTFDYFSDSQTLDEGTFNRTLFDLQIGDVSYEKIYEDGELALKDALRFYDANDNLYEKIPLQAVDKSVYKIDLISHDYIKENIEDLLSEYSAQYNSETGNDELKNIMNAIYATLETYYEDYDIVPRLDVIRKTFPDKTPVSTVGKLYKRFSKRIYNINKSIASAEGLFKRITYNSKIVDLRSIEVGDVSAPSYDPLGDLYGEYI